MPVYLCLAGSDQAEPWEHGIHVYSAPFPMDSSVSTNANMTAVTLEALPDPRNVVTDRGSLTGDLTGEAIRFQPRNTAQPREVMMDQSRMQNQGPNDVQRPGSSSTSPIPREGAHPATMAPANSSSSSSYPPIRRVRHAEVVLVDDVCISYDRYWLRLRWPGHKGGFAGYVAMGLVSHSKTTAGTSNRALPLSLSSLETREFVQVDPLVEDRAGNEDMDPDDPAREETASMPSAEPVDSTGSTLTCLRTGLEFQSSELLKLLTIYDDGIAPPVALAPLPTEPVICRICREGLHDDVDDEQPPAAADGDAEQPENPRPARGKRHTVGPMEDVAEPESRDPDDSSSVATKGPVHPHPPYTVNAEVLRNPILAPCGCSGSMAFVHYLCVEQWRCRSRHPEAHHGLNCETCGSPYALPPPQERPAHPMHDQEDWLDAMPPHVMQALRQPHIWWQIGAAIVRRRWLRPLAPIFMSPVVALYCRARRQLKKRGVARRRWACSLCRRRARWKCVRCLRSYYCSRQCQNVSWHIIHKHVCYKPARFWGSVGVYSLLTWAMFRDIVQDPLMYDLGLCLLPLSFMIASILGGGIATLVKRTSGFDMRGRALESAVVLSSLWIAVVCWGLVRGFFGVRDACYGVFGNYSASLDTLTPSTLLFYMRHFLLYPAQVMYLWLDRVVANSGSWPRALFCQKAGDSNGCFKYIPNANADFLFQEADGGRCASDALMVVFLYAAAWVSYAGSALWKHRERERRRHGRRQREFFRVGGLHAHQD